MVCRESASITTNQNVVVGTPYETPVIALVGEAGASIFIKITNGATPPTVGCKATLWLSPDTETWFASDNSFTGGTVSATSYDKIFYMDHRDRYGKVMFSGNTGQPVTVNVRACVVKHIYND